ncbi:MAG: hypothetical protein JHC87_03425 [Thermoleophilaceae bacterium]|nr:hypothetical protein [Thermoleophilaceae bacterium]
MSQLDTKALIEQAGQNFIAAVPALEPLKLSVKLDLQHRADHQLYRVEFPGPSVSKEIDVPAMVEMQIMRSDFNELADPKMGLKQWTEALETGKIKIHGDSAIIKLIANVVERQQRRKGG